MHLCHIANSQKSTGVINNLPPRVGETPQTSHSVPVGSSQGLRLANEPSKSSEHDDWTKMAEEKEAGKAAELALREVLGSIEAARYLSSAPLHTLPPSSHH